MLPSTTTSAAMLPMRFPEPLTLVNSLKRHVDPRARVESADRQPYCLRVPSLLRLRREKGGYRGS